MRPLILALGLLAGPLLAQPAEFDAQDFGKIVIAPRQSASGSGLTLEQAFGDYQNEPVFGYSAASIARKLGLPVGRLDLLLDNGKTAYCTAFIVDTQYIVTNHHCVPGLGGQRVRAAQAVFGYVQPGLAQGAEKFQVLVDPVESDQELDFAVLEVFGDPSERFGTVTISGEAPDDGGFLWIIGHPGGQAQHISREGCAASDPAVSQEGKLVHTCDTLQGNSGSPVFDILTQQVVGLHHAGDNRTGYNYAIPMQQIVAQSAVLSALVRAPTIAPEPDPHAVCTARWNARSGIGCADIDFFLTECADHPMQEAALSLANQQCRIKALEALAKQEKFVQAELSVLREKLVEILDGAEIARLRGAEIGRRNQDMSINLQREVHNAESLPAQQAYQSVLAQILGLHDKMGAQFRMFHALEDEVQKSGAKLRRLEDLVDMSVGVDEIADKAELVWQHYDVLRSIDDDVYALYVTARPNARKAQSAFDKLFTLEGYDRARLMAEVEARGLTDLQRASVEVLIEQAGSDKDKLAGALLRIAKMLRL